jgi:hypothetical protein
MVAISLVVRALLDAAALAGIEGQNGSLEGF